MALSGSLDKALRLWDLGTGNCLRTFEGHSDYVSAVYISPNGTTGLSGSSDKTLRLWDLAPGNQLHSDAVQKIGTAGYQDFASSSIRMIRPESGDTLFRLTEYIITWDQINLDGNLRIELLEDEKVRNVIIDDVKVTDGKRGSYRWKIPLYDAKRRYRIRVSAKSNPLINDTTGYFTICSEKFVRQYIQFKEIICSGCEKFYAERACYYSYKPTNKAHCLHFTSLKQRSKQEMMDDDQWWYKISVVMSDIWDR
jgi:predicted Fe-S protein YdhL (DUF1289 family)